MSLPASRLLVLVVVAVVETGRIELPTFALRTPAAAPNCARLGRDAPRRGEDRSRRLSLVAKTQLIKLVGLPYINPRIGQRCRVRAWITSRTSTHTVRRSGSRLPHLCALSWHLLR